MTMVTFGIHPFIWTSAWNLEALPLIDRAKALGFGSLDIPVRTLDENDLRETRARLKALDMGIVAVAGIGKEYDLTADDAAMRRGALDYVQKLVRNAAGLGATLLAGVFYAPLGKLVGRGPTEQELEWSAAGLRQAARYAADYGVRLALEPVSRYETYVLNTTEQGLAMLDRIGESNVGLQLDTYHMNIEERDFYAPLVRAGSRLFHVHACENDRGTPGVGLVQWDRVFAALRDISYSGGLSIESFAGDVPSVAGRVSVWRCLAKDGDALAADGLAFLKQMAEKYGL
jgi:D-psicose/D-tagatose/L-ribulose 3-epimerase